jgi:hypothetical protein
MWARSVPIRPEPMTATPIDLGFVMPRRIPYSDHQEVRP